MSTYGISNWMTLAKKIKDSEGLVWKDAQEESKKRLKMGKYASGTATTRRSVSRQKAEVTKPTARQTAPKRSTQVPIQPISDSDCSKYKKEIDNYKYLLKDMVELCETMINMSGAIKKCCSLEIQDEVDKAMAKVK